MKHIMKLIRICTRKEIISKAKSQHTEWDNICKPCNQLRFNMHSIQTQPSLLVQWSRLHLPTQRVYV